MADLNTDVRYIKVQHIAKHKGTQRLCTILKQAVNPKSSVISKPFYILQICKITGK